jgi:hypothetical protein
LRLATSIRISSHIGPVFEYLPSHRVSLETLTADLLSSGVWDAGSGEAA